MAAAGGDTVVPTNWMGLILTSLTIAVVAAATYFGMGVFLGDANSTEKPAHEATLEELYSSNATRGLEAMDTVRALPRTALASSNSLPPPVATNAEAESADAENTMDSADAAEDDSLYEQASTAMAAAAQSTAEAVEKAAKATGEAIKTGLEKAEVGIDRATAKMDAGADKARDTIMGEGDEPGAVEKGLKKAATAVDKAIDKARAAVSEKPAAEEQLDTRYRAEAKALRAWWTDGDSDDRLSIRFVGPLDSSVASNGVAILFDTPVDPLTAQSFITLQDAAGKTISTQWKSAQNPNLIYAAGLRSGQYALALDADLPARNGRTLGRAMSGPVLVN